MKFDKHEYRVIDEEETYVPRNWLEFLDKNLVVICVTVALIALAIWGRG